MIWVLLQYSLSKSQIVKLYYFLQLPHINTFFIVPENALSKHRQTPCLIHFKVPSSSWWGPRSSQFKNNPPTSSKKGSTAIYQKAWFIEFNPEIFDVGKHALYQLTFSLYCSIIYGDAPSNWLQYQSTKLFGFLLAYADYSYQKGAY